MPRAAMAPPGVPRTKRCRNPSPSASARSISATELRIAFSDGVKEYLQKDPSVFDPKKYCKAGIEKVVETVKAKIAVCGSAGKA